MSLSEYRKHFFVVFGITFLVYLWSTPETVQFEDDGLFIMAAYFNGIAHPPGYPLYTIVGHFMSKLPIGSVAFRIHLLSGVFASLACGLIWLLTFKLLNNRDSAYLASLSFGFSGIFWSQAIIAEVYTLNILIIVLISCLLIQYCNHEDPRSSIKILRWTGLIYGFGLSNHWPILILSTPMFLMLVWNVRQRLVCQLCHVLPFVMIGLLPYVWMIYRSQMNPDISFYGPISSWRDFLYIISREGYQQMDNSPTAGWWDKMMFGRYVLFDGWRQFAPVASLFVVAGLFSQWRLLGFKHSIALLAGYLGNTVILILLLNFDYDMGHQIVFRVYPLVAYFIMSVWLACGFQYVISILNKNFQPVWFILFLRKAGVFILCTVTFFNNVSANYRANDEYADNYSRVILGQLERDAIFIVNSDFTVLPVGYLNKIEGVRDDVLLYQSYGLIFNNRLFRGDNRMTEQERIAKLTGFIQDVDNPVYSEAIFPHQFAVDYYGLYIKLDKNRPVESFNFVFNQSIYNYFLQLFSSPKPVDPWSLMLYRYQRRDFCFLNTGLASFALAQDKREFFQDMVNQYCQNFYGALGQIDAMLLGDGHLTPEFDWQLFRHLLDLAVTQDQQAMNLNELIFIEKLKNLGIDRGLLTDPGKNGS